MARKFTSEDFIAKDNKGKNRKDRLTTEKFIAFCETKFADKHYDYSKTNVIDTKHKVCIICPLHGEFWTMPHNFLKTNGCPKCGKHAKFVTTEDFIKKAHEVHGDKYDYSKVEYVKSSEPICIICPEHGAFWQTPNAHLSGKNCPKCVGGVKKTTEDFIVKAREVHGDKYDYSKVEYVNNHTPIIIICSEHGEFEQKPSHHLRGRGCSKCAKSGIKMNTDDFIAKAKEVHGDKYDYSKVNYINAQTKVCIICPEHGEFEQTPNSHLNGNGCLRCSRPNGNISLSEFLSKAKEVHGDRYDYSKVTFEGITNIQKQKVCIICSLHGEFWQSPSDHLIGRGCANCNHGIKKEYKFNLLNEFVDEFRLRDFLMTNDENLIYIILRNIEKIDPKFNPIVKDIDRVLRSDSTNPIEDLENKYRASDETVTSDTVAVEINTTTIDDIDLDDDDAVEAFINNTNTTVEKTEPTIDELTRARENEINLINTIEHMLTPEDRQFIKDKFLNDKRRNWMLERDKNV